MSLFSHREYACGWRCPRHPIVCLLDVLGAAVSVGLLAFYRPPLATAVLPAAILVQYAVSIAHHALPFTGLRSKLDRGAIFLVIAATYVPYWSNLLPETESWQRLPWVAAGALIGIAFLVCGAPERVLGIFWAAFASAGLVVSFFELQEWLPPYALIAFWIGTALYGAQQAVYFMRFPDPVPGVFGYREVQHMCLVAATTIGSIVALEHT